MVNDVGWVNRRLGELKGPRGYRGWNIRVRWGVLVEVQRHLEESLNGGGVGVCVVQSTRGNLALELGY